MSELVLHWSPFLACLPHLGPSPLRRFLRTAGRSLGEPAHPSSLDNFVVRWPRAQVNLARSTGDSQNANARPSPRLITRAKPTSTTTAPNKATSTVTTQAKTVLADTKTDATAPTKRKCSALGEIAGPSNKNQEGKPMGKHTTKDKPKEKFDGVVLKKSTVTTTTTSTIRQPLKAVTGAVPQSRKAVISVSEQVQKLEQIRGDLPPGGDAMAIDPPHCAKAEILETKSLRVVASRKHLKPVDEVDDEESKRVVKKRRTSSSDLPEEAEVVARIPPEIARPKRSTTPEADPEGDQRDYLDAEDTDDPLMVSEYVHEIFMYLKEIEKTTMPNHNHVEMQKDLAWKIRGIFIDRLIQVHSRFRLLPETLFLCINIIDRFVSTHVVSLVKLQPAAITCMFIAAKVEEIISPSARNFLYCADTSYSEILHAERYVLETLDRNLNYANPIHFLKGIGKADWHDIQTRTIAKYLMEIQCLGWSSIFVPSPVLTAASVWLARLTLGREEWTLNLAHYSSYPESALAPTANIMFNHILKEPKRESFYKKYVSKKFLKVCAYGQEWALEWWPQGSPVPLLEDLPALKEGIRRAGAKELAESMAAAAEVGEVVPPSARNFLCYANSYSKMGIPQAKHCDLNALGWNLSYPCADSPYSVPEILQAKGRVLGVSDWDLSYRAPIHFIRRMKLPCSKTEIL